MSQQKTREAALQARVTIASYFEHFRALYGLPLDTKFTFLVRPSDKPEDALLCGNDTMAEINRVMIWLANKGSQIGADK